MVPRSTFLSVCEFIEVNFYLYILLSLRNFDKDNGLGQKNIDFIKQGLNTINSLTREHLSNEAKDFGNQLINKYEELASEVNLQRSTNLGLQLEINVLVKEKNTLRHDIKVLYELG